jgi:MscS family membrane protein
VLGFLDACAKRDYRRGSSYLSPPERQTGPALASQLCSVLDRFWKADPATLSSEPGGDTADGLAPDLELLGTVEAGGRSVDLALERVTRDDARVWAFSRDTVAAIPFLYQRLESGVVLERYLPGWMLARGPFETPLWVWIALLLIVGLSFAIASIVARLLLAALRPAVSRTQSELDDRLLRSIINPTRLLLATIAVHAGLLSLPASVLFRTYAGRLLKALIYLAAAWLAMRIIDVVANKVLATMGAQRRVSASAIVPLTRRTAKVLALVIAVLAILSSWGYNTTTLIAGLGVGGLAVALAAQKTLENLFGGVAVATDRPVLVGDFCRYGDKFGTVEDIGLRSTRIRTLDRTVVTIPNGQFSALEIENFGRRDKIFFHPILNLRRETTPDQLRALIAGLREILLAHPKVDPSPARVRFIGIGQYSLDIEIFSYVQTTEYDTFLVVQEELLLSILDLVASTGTALAVPSQLNVVTRDRLSKGLLHDSPV